MDGDRLDAHLAAGALDAQGDLAAVGDEDLVEHRGAEGPIRRWNSGWPYSTGCPFSTRIALTMPEASASISFISFIASMMQMVSPSFTAADLDEGLGVGGGAR